MKSTAYKFRAECTADSKNVNTSLLPWLSDWKEERYDGCPDVEVSFNISNSGPTFGEILWLINRIDDCHVVIDTLLPTEKYTGERDYGQNFETNAEPPNAEIIKKVMESKEMCRKILNSEENEDKD
jgi:hypothetical protein